MAAGSSSRACCRMNNSIADASALRSSRNARAFSVDRSPSNPCRVKAHVWRSRLAPTRMPDDRVRLAIVDDHPIFRDGLRRLLESEPDLRVVAEGTDGVDAIRIAREERPDIMLLDVAMPRLGGVDAL